MWNLKKWYKWTYLQNRSWITDVNKKLVVIWRKEGNKLCDGDWHICTASLVAQTVKNLPTMQETWVQFLGWGDPLEKEIATHSSILAWRIPRAEEPVRLQTTGSQRIVHVWVIDTHTANKNLLNSTGNSFQYTVMTYMGIESKKSIYVYMCNWPCCTAETNTTL